jgi:hypothetical protein
MATLPWDIQTASEEWLVEYCNHIGKENGRISTYHHEDQVIKLSDNIAVKYGHGVKVSEAKSQDFARRNVDPSIVHVPQVHRFFSWQAPSWPRPKGYLFMEYIPSQLLQDVDLNLRVDIISQVAKIIEHLGQI